MNKDKLYIPAFVSSMLSSVVTVLFIFQMVAMCAGKSIPTEKVNGFSMVFMLVCAFMNIIIAFTEGRGLVAIFLPISIFVGLAIASISPWGTSMTFLVIMLIATAAFTVVNISNLNEYLHT